MSQEGPLRWAPGGGKEGQGPKQKGKGKAKTEEKKDDKKKESGATASTEAKGKEKEVEEAWLAMIDGIESKDEGSDDEGEPMKNDFCWSNFEEFEDLKNIVNNISDPYELKELTIDPNKITIDPLSAITDLDPDNGAYTTTFGTNELAGSAETQRSEIDLGQADICLAFIINLSTLLKLNPYLLWLLTNKPSKPPLKERC